MMTLIFSDEISYRIGEAIKDLAIALGGWVDWGRDGKVRFLCRNCDGSIGMFFPKWFIDGMKENKDHIRRYIELLKIEREQSAQRLAITDKLSLT